MVRHLHKAMAVLTRILHMHKILPILAFLLVLPCAVLSPVYANTDEAIKQKIIKQSLSTYPGNCPCPYNTDRAGRSCGRRSAYSKPGGYAPICYPDDVTPQMIQQYKKSHPSQ